MYQLSGQITGDNSGIEIDLIPAGQSGRYLVTLDFNGSLTASVAPLLQSISSSGIVSSDDGSDGAVSTPSTGVVELGQYSSLRLIVSGYDSGGSFSVSVEQINS